jgi:NAD(P)H dehydrogenase (quinone)
LNFFVIAGGYTTCNNKKIHFPERRRFAMILVTGAAGKTGQAVIRALASRGGAIRALAHKPEQVEHLRSLGAQEVLVGDMLSQVFLEQATRGIQSIYHICPNVDPYETVIGAFAIQAARHAGVEHFVYHSVLHPQAENMPHHWKKMRVEELLLESGLGFTIMQPTVYMQNVLAYWDRIMAEHVYAVPYPVETRLSMIDLDDLAEAAALVLTQPGHLAAIYELAGCVPVSQTEIVQTMSEKLGFSVQAETLSLEKWESQARRLGMGDYQVETLLKMFEYYAKFGLHGNPQVLTWLLGRKPADFAGFIECTARRQQKIH